MCAKLQLHQHADVQSGRGYSFVRVGFEHALFLLCSGRARLVIVICKSACCVSLLLSMQYIVYSIQYTLHIIALYIIHDHISSLE